VFATFLLINRPGKALKMKFPSKRRAVKPSCFAQDVGISTSGRTGVGLAAWQTVEMSIPSSRVFRATGAHT
jgi:hypothetical protein